MGRDRPWGSTSLLYNWYWIFPRGKERPGRDADPSPPSSAMVKKEYSYTSTPPMGRTACTEPQCLYSTAIPLLPLRTVWSVQSLNACTVQLYLYSPYGPYGLYRASVPVQYSYTSTPPMGRTACTEPRCLYSRAIPLLPLWAVRPVQSLSACTVQLYLYSPYGPYGLYRASVPVQRCTLPLPSKLLPNSATYRYQ